MADDKRPLPPDQADVPVTNAGEVKPPQSVERAPKDVYEDGLIPVDEPVPPEVLAVQAKVAEGEAAVAEGIKNTTDTNVLAALAKDGVTIEDIKRILADTVAAQQAEMQALRQELQQVKTAGKDGMLGEDASVGGMPWMYWRLPNHAGFKSSGRAGWIQYAPGGATPRGARDVGSYSTYLKKGMVPVTKYGFIAPPTKPQAYLDSFLPILRAPGGTAEFPASQVIAHNWHKHPPIKGLKFEQYEALKGSIKNWICEACGEQRFFMPSDQEIGTVYRTHLMIDHKYPFREAAEAVKSQGFSLTAYAADTIEDMMAKTSPDA